MGSAIAADAKKRYFRTSGAGKVATRPHQQLHQSCQGWLLWLLPGLCSACHGAVARVVEGNSQEAWNDRWHKSDPQRVLSLLLVAVHLCTTRAPQRQLLDRARAGSLPRASVDPLGLNQRVCVSTIELQDLNLVSDKLKEIFLTEGTFQMATFPKPFVV